MFKLSQVFFSVIFQHENEVMVDLSCGMAVLRGADVFAQGIMAAPPGEKNIYQLEY